MANTKTSALTALAAQPASNDLLPLVDVSDTTQAASGSLKKIAAAYFVQTTGTVVTITGGGTIALGGFTLTVPATGTASLLGAAQTYTAAKTFSVAPIVPATINAELFALDSSGTTFSLTAAQSLPFSASGAFSGLLIIIEPATGAGALYLVSGGNVNLISSIGGIWTANTTSGSNQFDVSFVSSKYRLLNKYGTTKTFNIMALKVRNAS